MSDCFNGKPHKMTKGTMYKEYFCEGCGEHEDSITLATREAQLLEMCEYIEHNVWYENGTGYLQCTGCWNGGNRVKEEYEHRDNCIVLKARAILKELER